MKYILLKGSYIIITFLIISSIATAENLYKDFEESNTLYKNGNYTEAGELLAEIRENYPDYFPASLLYYKVMYNTKSIKKVEAIYKQILNSNEDIKEDILNFFIEKEDIEKSEEVYLITENKSKFRYRMAELMYKHKLYTKVIREYPEKKVIDMIEKDKNLANSWYFKAMAELKTDAKNSSKPIEYIENAVKSYPVNYIYYYRLGQLYADKKNFYLAEYNFRKAIEYNESKEIYLNLFRLYSENNDYEMIYQIAPFVIEYPEVKIKLKEMHKNRVVFKNKIRVARVEENKYLYIDRRNIVELKAGDGFFIERTKDVIYDKLNGEKLIEITEKVCKVRVYDIKDKIAVFYIVESYIPITTTEDYVISN